ncbi:MAG: TetR/AcrR family transcriptional regulator [Proteobacteria bacterium]|nr:TetR/AcrR family transcriptional regulator [Pseudomonadota bacterium]
MFNSKSQDEMIYERVLNATRNLLSTRGVKGWNMDMLSQKANLSKRTLYKIIGTKEKIVGDVIIRYIQGIQREIAVIVGQEQDFLKITEEVLVAYPGMLNTNLTEVIPDIFHEYPGIEAKVLGHQDELTQRILDFIREGMDRGVLNNEMTPEDIFDVLRALVHYYTTTSRSSQNMADRLKKAFHLTAYGFVKTQVDKG